MPDQVKGKEADGSVAKKRNKEGVQPDYTTEESKRITFLDNRLERQLFTSRKQVGLRKQNVEKLWDAADRAYVPHNLRKPRKKHLVQDELLGHRSVLTKLGVEDDWQSDKAKPDVYIKVQTALSILNEGNPEGVFIPGGRKFEQTNLLAKGLYKKSWNNSRSRQQLKNNIFNVTKYGWGAMRTYPHIINQVVRDPKAIDFNDPEKTEYVERKMERFNGIWRENMPVRHAWVDDMARPGDYLHVRDAAFYKKYSVGQFEREFGKYKYAEHVMRTSLDEEKGNTANKSEHERKLVDKNTIDMYFYENQDEDSYSVRANDVWVIPEAPLPALHHSLSLYWTHWTLRDDSTIYGIGIYEAIRHDVALQDQIRNMTIDQVVLMIYKFFLYSGTNQKDSTGTIKITPGMGKQISDVKNFKWNEMPPVGTEPFKLQEMVSDDIDDASGVSKPIQGKEVGKTAFELKVVRDAGLQRLKTPLENIADMLTQEGYLTVALNEQMLSIPEVVQITDPENIAAYMEEINENPELFESFTNEETGEFVFNARIPKEVQLSLDEDDEGNLIESENERFFRIIPSKLKWEGTIRIDPQSVLAPSKELEKQIKLELFNLIQPIIQGSIGLQPETSISAEGQVQPGLLEYIERNDKSVKNIIRIYEEDVNDWLPESWLHPENAEVAEQPQPAAPEEPAPEATQETQGGAQEPLFVSEGASGAAQGNAPQRGLQELPQAAGRDIRPAGNAIQRLGRRISGAVDAFRGR